MRFKKIYIEVTNGCNLNCDFCVKNSRKVINISFDNYKYIIDKVKSYTKEVYLHVLGEPLMHKDINKFIEYANNEGLMVNITTNGYLINNINNYNIHRLNISLHSYNKKYNKSLDNYLDDIFNFVDKIRDNTFVSLRLWTMNKESINMLNYINNRYNTNISNLDNNSKIKISSNLIIDTFHPFVWPDLNNNYYSIKGKCMGLINHIGILSDGRIIPCCLDSKGDITLGNIYDDNIENILNKNIVKEMVNGFKNNYKCQELCRHCNFLDN